MSFKNNDQTTTSDSFTFPDGLHHARQNCYSFSRIAREVEMGRSGYDTTFVPTPGPKRDASRPTGPSSQADAAHAASSGQGLKREAQAARNSNTAGRSAVKGGRNA
ncbi:hypothetical protein D7B24_007020 [Verticillium nonalfalfae]|uniref:Uncharacterized protein n=1 Tax=Verticillium nonalfalfae TaxID=1051616 RepID=A0A3M9YA67_9PEZI|nr:uncharacterized protein D7B24_007020 [Verticillium nonalfalfae]RNJ56656.1 hypothetical protein D7B24_007020 [Verticillium nonalfalfae]